MRSFFSLFKSDVPSEPFREEGQSIVLAKLVEFLKLTAPDTSQELQESLRNGHCDGFSRIHGPMERVKKLRWWEAALVEVALWDRKPESLDAGVLLPDAETNLAVPLRTIFNRVLNYVVSANPDPDEAPDFRIKGIYFANAYNTENKFEISTATEYYRVKRCTVMAGYFSKAKLFELLDEGYFKDTSTMVGSTHHAIRIGYLGENQWLIYDPNYTHNKRQRIHKILPKDKFIDELIRIQGNSIRIVIAHLKPPKAKNWPRRIYLEMLENELPELLQEYGLHVILRQIPQYLPYILKKAHQDEKVAAAITKAVTKIPVIITCSCLRAIVQYHPQHLDEFLKVVAKSKAGSASLKIGYEDFSKADSYGDSALTNVAQYNLPFLPKMLGHLKEMKETASRVIAESLAVKHKKTGKPGLMILDEYAPDYIPELLSLAVKHDKGVKYLWDALSMEFAVPVTKAKDAKDQKEVKASSPPQNITCFEHLASTQSKNLSVIMASLYSAESKENSSKKIEFVSAKLLTLIARYQPKQVENILTSFNVSSLSNYMLESPLGLEENGLCLLNQQARPVLSKLIDYAAQDRDSCHHLILALIKKTNDKTCFDRIMEHEDRSTLPDICESITKAITKQKHEFKSTQTKTYFMVLAASMSTLIAAAQFEKSDSRIVQELVTLAKTIGSLTGLASSFLFTDRMLSNCERAANSKEIAQVKERAKEFKR